jgi:hypothetical protein
VSESDELPSVVLDEIIPDADYPFRCLWRCEPPAFGQMYRVVRGEWSDDYQTRTVYAWEAATSLPTARRPSPAAIGDTTPTNTP